jgi:hypothetical protein
VVLSEKGLAAYFKKDGARAYATEKIKEVDYFYQIGDNYFFKRPTRWDKHHLWN